MPQKVSLFLIVLPLPFIIPCSFWLHYFIKLYKDWCCGVVAQYADS